MNRVSRIPTLFIVMTLVLTLGLVACNDDNPTDAGPVGDEGLATSLVSDVVVPLVETLSLNNYVSLLPAPGSPALTLNQPECTTIPICSSGTAQSCPGQTGYEVGFGDCALNGIVVDGSVILVPVDETSGAATIDITLDGDPLVGSATWAIGQCFTQTFDLLFTSTSIAASASVTGTMTFCDPPVMVNDIPVPNDAYFMFILETLKRRVDVYIFQVPESDPQISVEVSDLEFNYIMSCDGPLFGKPTCHREP